MNVDFELPQKWLDPKNKDYVMHVANRIAAIRYGDEHRRTPPEMQLDGSVHFPLTNDHWLYPPTKDIGQPKNYWRLTGRYDNEEALGLIVKALQLWL